MEQSSATLTKKEVSEASFEYIIAEILNMDQNLPDDDAATSANSVRRLESIGHDIGFRMAERLSYGHKYIGPDPLDLIKFICKEFWEEIFRKKIDKLQTNHKGVFVLTDTRFRWLEKYSSDDITSKQAAARMLTLPCGIIRGALANMGILAIVNADFNNLPSCFDYGVFNLLSTRISFTDASSPVDVKHIDKYKYGRLHHCILKSMTFQDTTFHSNFILHHKRTVFITSDLIMQSARGRVQEEDVSNFRVVGDLQSAGVNVADIKKLQEAGIMTVGTVLQTSSRDLLSIKGLTEARVEKIKEAARKLDSRGNQFKTGLEMKEKRKQIVHITTGSSALDRILGGGVETSSITELFGEFRTGKTQLSHTLCVTTQLSFENNGGQGKVVYIDTEGNFRPERIEAIAERFGLDIEQTLDNIIVCRVFSHEEQMEIVKPVAALLADVDQGPFRLLIVDSIIALFRVEFSGRGELSERQQKLGQHLSHLVRIAEEFNVAIVVVNQCMADPGAMSMFGPVIKPVGGHVLAHASTTRVMLKKGKAEQRIAKIFDSPLMPEEEATFQIANGGIEDCN